MSILGSWDAVMRTPIGSVTAVFSFSEEDGALVGTAEGSGDRVEMRAVTAHGDGRFTWAQSVRKPMRLNLEFDVQVEGDELHGTSRAGRLPRSAVTGARRSD